MPVEEQDTALFDWDMPAPSDESTSERDQLFL
jgi:hypothetical protein